MSEMAPLGIDEPLDGAYIGFEDEEADGEQILPLPRLSPEEIAEIQELY